MDSLNTALVECVKALGGSGKVGPKLHPEKSPDAAQRALLDQLNPDRPAHLTPDQMIFILRLARAKGYHGGMEWLCTDLHYAPPVPSDPVDEVAELQRQFISAQAGMVDILGRMEKLQGIQHFPTLRAAA